MADAENIGCCGRLARVVEGWLIDGDRLGPRGFGQLRAGTCQVDREAGVLVDGTGLIVNGQHLGKEVKKGAGQPMGATEDTESL